MAEADWDEVTYLRKKPAKGSHAKSQQVMNVAQLLSDIKVSCDL